MYRASLLIFELNICITEDSTTLSIVINPDFTRLMGFLQGSILGPLLFIIYGNDLPKCVEIVYITMYANETESSAMVNTCNDIIESVKPDLSKVCD